MNDLTAGPALSIRQLRKAYDDASRGGFLAGSDRLYHLQRRAVDCALHLSEVSQTVCRALADLFGAYADMIAGEAVTADTGAAAFSILDQPIRQCLDALQGKAGSDPATAISALNEARTRLTELLRRAR